MKDFVLVIVSSTTGAGLGVLLMAALVVARAHRERPIDQPLEVA